MIINTSARIIFLILLLNSANVVQAQTASQQDSTRFRTIQAGPQYERSGFYQWLWGRNYRKEWTKPVTLPVIYLDTLRGGLVSYKVGGGNQSKSLHLTTAGEKEYALRSVDKTLDKVIPEIFEKTFVADIANDAISMSNPYGALAVPGLAKAIGIHHTLPAYYYLPAQKALDTLNDTYAGKMYLLEQRPKGDWNEANNLGNFEKFEDFDDMMEDILKDSKNSIDQRMFLRTRLLDMIIGDFDRHGDQFKFGIKKEGKNTIYVPVPTDRDQAFSTRNGLLLDLVIRLSGLKFIQKFNHKIDKVKALAQINRLLDRLALNKLTLSEWQAIATDVKQKLTDDVIENSVKNLPPEIFAIRGNEIISHLKSRRNDIVSYATTYYGLIAEETEIAGTEGDDYFEINHLPQNRTEVKIYSLDKNRQKENNPFYSRIFIENETDELRLYGLEGKDIYAINGKLNKEIEMRIIGGTDRDSIIDNSQATGRFKIQVYDNADNHFPSNANLKMHLSEDPAVHVYDYNKFLQDKKGLLPHLGVNDDDRIFAGIRYQIINHKWRKRPFVYKQTLDVDYSITQKAFSTTYNGLFPALLGRWDLVTRANYDWERWINFYGLGNETPSITDNRDYYRMRFQDGSVNAGLNRTMGKHNIKLIGFLQRVSIIQDTARFVDKEVFPITPGVYSADNFTGAQFSYNFAAVKDSILPDRGITFSLNAKHTQNLENNDRSFQTYSGNLQLFIPLIPKISLAVKTGGATVSGNPLFYQYPNIGQSYDLRGFRRERFSGETTFYNNVELRFISKFRSYFFNGKAGLMAFVDNGRVWMPGEDSNKMHTAYGGGILIAPFNMVSAAITYGISDEIKMLQIRLGVLF